jgi:arylsulfatase A
MDFKEIHKQMLIEKEKYTKLLGPSRTNAHDEYLDSIKVVGNEEKKSLPNIVFIMMDDMGWGDISAFGSQAISTPNIDKIAQNGVAFINGYSSSPVCTPSRTGFLTGRYPSRSLISNVFFPTVEVPDDQVFPMGYTDDKVISGEDVPDKPPLKLSEFYPMLSSSLAVNGFLPDEITSAEALKARGYATGLFGKWHLGDQSPSLPNDKGFDYFYGSHYSNDMCPFHYYRNREIAVEGIIDQSKLTGMLTEEVTGYIDRHSEEPFFLYYASPWPHHPLSVGDDFKGTSKAGVYGDCIQEVDWSVGEIVKKLEEKGIAENTLIIFTSDNGPWHQGSPGLHRGRKGNCFDGGQVVPTLACWPGTIPGGQQITEQMMNIDFFPTFLKMAGISLSEDREIDGEDILPLMTGEMDKSPHDELLYISGMHAYGLRNSDHFKYFASTGSENAEYGKHGMMIHPFLFDLNVDPNESYDQSSHYPERTKKMRDRLYEFNRSMETNPRGWK